MKITFGKISTKELAALAERVINSSENGKYTVVENHELLLEIKNEYENYDKVYNKLTFSGRGEDVAAADEARDKVFSNLKDFLKSYSKMTSMANFEDAVALYKVLKKTGLNIHRNNYAEQTALMKKLIEDLNTEENQEKIVSLNIMSVYDNLIAAQSRFEGLYAAQAEANAELRFLPSASDIRNNLQKDLDNYFKLLSAMKNIPGWEMIYVEINELVKKAGERKTSKSKEEEPEEEEVIS